jgi:multidrug resistance efflux pump
MEETSLHSFRGLEQERFGAPIGIFSMAVLLGGLWTAWLFFGSIGRYAVTEVARLEVEGQAHPIIAMMNGVVVASYMTLGEEVARGQLLAELESVDMQFDLVNLQAQRAGLARQIETIRNEMDAQDHALRDTRRAVSPALDEARDRMQAAEVAADLAERRVARTQPQHELNYVSEVYWDSVSSDARQKRATAKALRASLTRIDVDGQLRQSEKKAQLAALARELEHLEAELTSVDATAAHVEHERQHSFIIAPASGHLGEAVPLQPGATVHDGDRLGAVIPAGRLRVIATFPAEQAIGRIRPGQRARLRLTSLPWVQYGTLPATVTHLANEGAQGNVRVELAVQGADRFPAPLEHGLAATLEVEIERVSPITLVLRAVGRRVDRVTVEQPSGLARVPSQ